MNESFTLTGKINLGEAYEAPKTVMMVAMESLRYSQQVPSEKSEMPTVMDQVPVLGWEEITSKVLSVSN